MGRVGVSVHGDQLASRQRLRVGDGLIEISTPTTTGTTAVPNTSTRRRANVTARRPSEQATDAAIDAASRLLRLPTMRDRYAEIADAAGREQLSYRAFLAELLLAECDDRTARRAVRRVHEAGFPDQRASRTSLQREHRDQPGHHQHPGRGRLDQQGTVAVSDRRLRHRKEPSANPKLRLSG